MGKIFGGGSKQQTTSRTNFVQLRDDAIAAGFNPLTALQATGGSGNVTQTSADLSSNQFIADALTNTIDTHFNREQVEMDRAVQELQRKKMELEVKDYEQRLSGPRGMRGGPFGHTIPIYDETPVHSGGRLAVGVSPAISSRASRPETQLPGNATNPANGGSTGPHRQNADKGSGNGNGTGIAETSSMKDGGDGFMRADPENPRESEADAWAWALNGVMFDQGDKLLEKNIPDLSSEGRKKLYDAMDKKGYKAIPYFGRLLYTKKPKFGPDMYDLTRSRSMEEYLYGFKRKK